jgi:hypothetical protein
MTDGHVRDLVDSSGLEVGSDGVASRVVARLLATSAAGIDHDGLSRWRFQHNGQAVDGHLEPGDGERGRAQRSRLDGVCATGEEAQERRDGSDSDRWLRNMRGRRLLLIQSVERGDNTERGNGGVAESNIEIFAILIIIKGMPFHLEIE